VVGHPPATAGDSSGPPGGSALNEDTLARMRQALGDDHIETLVAASSLAADLHQRGKHERARDLNQDVLPRLRRVLGEHHPDTLVTAVNLAADLRALGEYREAGWASTRGQPSLTRRS
jgi:Tetratricopeptide repeat